MATADNTLYALDFSTPVRSVRLLFSSEQLAVDFSRTVCRAVCPANLPYLRFAINRVPLDLNLNLVQDWLVSVLPVEEPVAASAGKYEPHLVVA